MLSVALTENAELRALEPWQGAEFFEHIDSARDYLDTWLPWVARIVDAGSAEVLLQSYADRQAKGEGRIYGIWIDGKLVGGTLFRTFDQRFNNCEVGVWLAPEAVGRGLVTRAVRLMIEWAVEERGMARVVWQAGATNTRSLATAERIGFTKEGVHREEFPHNGVRHDIVVYSILADEWRSLRGGNGGVVGVVEGSGDGGAAVAQGE
ncbi:Protein N-acetyltransferase, RimJ/RimL family [Actinokineospora alba]|uniref:Protein N-acetyltransferase, RimJ/RimL family n=1 Tax=Actinokineospora alba TaxID=504798 RepID=A0A1H0I3M1_9PSEU|nr:GNAT family protein [Actinokineospora alba]TDP64619.1 RimJ/RimL family protein N-acetyltransferase [Actinokineospora alba]SDI85812.1 Protein N-acetyltransferase, RimJ/RimL family [Actinokineospora alba]SDO26032.1 Protein N-acetyltransferase, RimJ/RimL family [Actinokineospora alba]